MTTEEAMVYREIQRNAETAIKAIDTIAPKVWDDDLALQIETVPEIFGAVQ